MIIMKLKSVKTKKTNRMENKLYDLEDIDGEDLSTKLTMDEFFRSPQDDEEADLKNFYSKAFHPDQANTHTSLDEFISQIKNGEHHLSDLQREDESHEDVITRILIEHAIRHENELIYHLVGIGISKEESEKILEEAKNIAIEKFKIAI